jgi:hypothetical protein
MALAHQHGVGLPGSDQGDDGASPRSLEHAVMQGEVRGAARENDRACNRVTPSELNLVRRSVIRTVEAEGWSPAAKAVFEMTQDPLNERDLRALREAEIH